MPDKKPEHVTAGALAKKLQGVPEGFQLAFAVAEHENEIKAVVAEHPSLTILWIAYSPVPEGTIWGGAPARHVALGLLLVPNTVVGVTVKSDGTVEEKTGELVKPKIEIVGR